MMITSGKKIAFSRQQQHYNAREKRRPDVQPNLLPVLLPVLVCVPSFRF